MKKMKKFAAILAVAMLSFTMAMPAFADEAPTTTETPTAAPASITIENASKGETYTVYKIFDATVGANGEIAYKFMSDKTAAPSGFTASETGYITAAPTTLTEAQKTELARYGVLVESEVADGSALVFEGLDDGYYFIKTHLVHS